MTRRTEVLLLCVLCVCAPVPPAFAQCPDGTPPPCAGARARSAAVQHGTIAVLPFANRSPDTADAYLADEFPEQITGRLSRIAQLHVTSATAVAAQWRRTPDALASARALRVEWLVTGALRRTQSQISASVELVRAATGEQAWSSLMRRSDGDIAAIEAMVAESVAVAATGRLAPGQRAAIVRRDSRNPEAYRLYLYARALMARRTRPDIAAAVTALGSAVRIEPGFAAAWARLAQARSLQTQYGNDEGLSDDSLMALGWTMTQRALSLDTASAEPWLALGMWESLHLELDRSRRALDRAARLDSLDANIENQFGYLYSRDLLTLPDLAERHYRRAVELNPDLRIGWRHIGLSYGMRGDLRTAIAYVDTSLANGGWQVGFLERAWLRFLSGDRAGAFADQAAADNFGPVPPLAVWALKLAARRAVLAMARGDSAAALAMLADRRPVAEAAMYRAMVAVVLGRGEEALAALADLESLKDPNEPTCAQATPCSVSLRTWQLVNQPEFLPLRGDPRFQRVWNDTRPQVPWLEAGGTR